MWHHGYVYVVRALFFSNKTFQTSIDIAQQATHSPSFRATSVPRDGISTQCNAYSRAPITKRCNDSLVGLGACSFPRTAAQLLTIARAASGEAEDVRTRPANFTASFAFTAVSQASAILPILPTCVCRGLQLGAAWGVWRPFRWGGRFSKMIFGF